MTIDEARQIKEWRVNGGCSWRRVAEKAAEMWPDKGYESGHQLEGRELCNEAMDVLGEGADDGWN
jgi:hypothetical protein